MGISKKLGTVTLCLLIALTVVIASADCPIKKEYRSMVKEATKDYFTDPTPEKLTELQSMLRIYSTGDFTKCEKTTTYVNKTETSKILLSIVDVDKMLAEQVLETAENTPIKNPKLKKKVEKEIKKAKSYFQKAEDKVSAEKYDKAIDNYKKSWEHSQQAIKFANK